MAQYTFLQLKTAVEHALGRVPDSRTTSGQVVNRAIEHLFNAHPWSWRKRVIELNFTNGQNFISLPADFGEVVEVERGLSVWTGDIRKIVDSDLAVMTRSAWTRTGMMGWLLYGVNQATPADPGTFHLRVVPTPLESVTSAIIVTYNTRVPDAISSDTALPPVPVGSHDTLMAICRAMAVSMEEQSDSHEWQVAKVMIDRDIAADLRIVGNLPGAAKTATATNLFTLKGEATLAAGPAASTLNLGHIVNDALQMLWNAHAWKWKRKRDAINSATTTVEYSLPTDFGQLIDLNTIKGHSIYPAQEDEITYWNNGATISPTIYQGFFYAITYTTGLQAKLRVFPAPGETTTGFWLVNYEKAPTLLSAESDVPNIPVSLYPLLRRLVVAMAKQSVGQPSEMDWQLYQKMLDQAMKQDGNVQRNLGQLHSQFPTSQYEPWADPRRISVTVP